ncbi:MAG: HlyD family type I secretion periplasmic adaptor subunit [Thermodesulfobacteriota bacterium]
MEATPEPQPSLVSRIVQAITGLWRRIMPPEFSDEDYQRLADESTPPPDDLEIRHTSVRTIVQAGLIIVAIFFGMGGVWIAVAEITGAVIASGEVKVDTERKTVQHLEGGIVRQIFVQNGSRVKAGQPLVELESSRVLAGVEQLRLQLVADALAIARLTAEKDLGASPAWPKGPEGVAPEKFQELLDNESKLFASRRAGLNTQRDLLRKQIEQLNEQEASLNDRHAAQQQVVAALEEELAAKEPLLAERFIDKTAILALRRSLAENRGQLAQFRGARAEAREKIAEYRLRINALELQYRQEAVTKLAEVQQHQFDRQQQLAPMLDASQRLTVTAPLAGEVVDMKVHSVGGVISPGQPLLDIVPENSQLVVECRIQVKDITHVHSGQDADVQLLAFNQRTTPKIKGKVVYVSADRLVVNSAAGAMPFYVVHVALDKEELVTNNLYLTSGMPATAFIKTEPRTVLDYIIEPLKERFDQALREN